MIHHGSEGCLHTKDPILQGVFSIVQFGTWLRANAAGRCPMVGRNARFSLPTRPKSRVEGPTNKSIGFESCPILPIVSHDGSHACLSFSVGTDDGKFWPMGAGAQPDSIYIHSSTGPMQEGFSRAHTSDFSLNVSPRLHGGRLKDTCSLNTGTV